jgi:hypothetical protein
MEFINREQLISEMTQMLQELMEEYDLEEIGVYEEEGEGNQCYFGFTVRKDGHVYMINNPFIKNSKGEVAPASHEWTVQSETGENKGYTSLDEVFNRIESW